jgi:CHC2-type zinc finger protein
MLAAFDRDAVDAVDALTIFQGAVPTLRRRGNGERLMGLCPFHKEKNPSFSVNPVKQLYYCFTCGKGGDVIDFVMQLDGVGFIDAARRVGAMRPVTVEEREKLWKQRREAARKNQQREYLRSQERDLFLRVRRDLLLFEAMARQSEKMLTRCEPDLAEILAESIVVCHGAARELAAAFTLLAFGPEQARRDYVLHPERRHRWRERVMDRGYVRDDRGRRMDVLWG